jgi:hypothetical protein
MREAESVWKLIMSRKRIWLTPILVIAFISLGIVLILQGATIPHFNYRLY